MATSYKVGDGRVWIQLRKFQPFELLLPYGLTNITDPVGALNAVREPDPAQRGMSVISDIVTGEPALPSFTLETRMKRTQNYMMGLKNRIVNIQGHLGACDRADNQYTSEVVVHFERARRGDLGVDRLSKIEGDNASVGVQTPFVSEEPMAIYDMLTRFLSARTIAETEAITGIAFMNGECQTDFRTQEDVGENGYLCSGLLGGSAGNIAQVWYTDDSGETWTQTSTTPFDASMTISAIVVVGRRDSHRVIVSNGTTRPSDPAQIAYADITSMGQATWVKVDVGAVDGQYIKDLLFIDWAHVYASTDDGYVYKSIDGGASWTAAYSAGAVDINAIAGLSDGTVYAVGNSNLIVKSEDGGTSWTALTGPGTISEDLTCVCVTPDGTVFVGDNAGQVFGSVRDSEWDALPLQGVVPTAVVKIVNSGDSNIYVAVTTAAGGKVLRSIDGGASFRLWNLNIPANSGLSSMYLVDDNTVWVSGAPQGSYGFLTRTNSRVVGLI
jgi:photosystem II stability/assembly factor-like uncharacterized protein